MVVRVAVLVAWAVLAASSAAAAPQGGHKTAACPASILGECSGTGECDSGACTCALGYQPPTCLESMLEACPDRCFGHGTCDAATAACRCDPMYKGASCGETVGCDALAFCSGHGSCSDANACECAEGWTGRTCSQRLACPDNCGGRGVCVVNARNHTAACKCDAGFSGVACARSLSSPCPFACSGHGVCNHTTGRCECSPGFGGPACTAVRVLCGWWCGHGSCKVDPSTSSPVCECARGYAGANCATRLAGKLGCHDLGFCSGHGQCDSATGKCHCAPGFVGASCAEADSQSSPCPSSCSGHGKCVYAASGEARCECEARWKGDDCAVPKCPTDDDERVCGEHGVCEEPTPGTFACHCDAGFSGVACDSRAAVCVANCSRHGACVDGECQCYTGWSGPTCAVALNSTQPEPECCPYNCSDNGVCNMEACRCECNQDWQGDACNVFAAGDELAMLAVEVSEGRSRDR